MKIKLPLFCLFFVAALAACSTTEQKHSADSALVTKDARVLKSHQQQELAQDQKDRAQVLAKKREMTSAPLSLLSPQKSGASSMQAPGSILEPSDNKAEGQLYAEIVDRYQANDRMGFSMRAKNYLGRFQEGDRRDQVCYMAGVMALADHQYGEALQQFNRILRDHPEGRQAPGAMFAKGITFQRMNLAPAARETLQAILTQFPGSPEAERAKMELKLIR
jgi:TolA-binding protein